MLTVNQINQQFKIYFENHAQINSVYVEDDFDFASETEILYPVANIQPVSTSTKGYEIISKYKFIIGDIQDPENSNSENEIWNDCELIAGDFLTYFGYEDGLPFIVDTDTTFQRFSESQGDITAGIVFAIQVRQTRDINTCGLPLKSQIYNP